ncbi:hypothetical protein CROQUDRAFT_36809 [Cronartium quercuum f. sp. fusiforme G11]|uniref:Major facilitator superfamily (MFS) profile domain-containing protein n=1 Tax=Cronartium quercuum f. sp. fusiforme G11 TaxID=708437 RepID=A0A9P6NQD2_9BASI|nr:hypothetical protein CROQUDRAFT_36809 [Cronartium quercuum f. sp. fusiforme G11]
MDTEKTALQRKVVRIIFFSLLLDLLAFTMPLPLFPRLIASFVEAEKSQQGTLLSRMLGFIQKSRAALLSLRASDLASYTTNSVTNNSKWDVTILGGLLGSIFSFCQFIVSPYIGRLSDGYGRRPVLLLTMVGNIASALLWLFSTSFGPYLLSRAIGGLSEGNVQLGIAIISDVSDPSTRAKSMALVGIAFSVCFTLGPSLGAWFAMNIPNGKAAEIGGIGLNIYAAPAAITLAFLLVETVYLFIALPETKQYSETQTRISSNATHHNQMSKPTTHRTLQQRHERLKVLRKIHSLFLFFFSGAEFTLTFLTYDLYSFTNAQNGRLLGLIGVLSSLLQGGYIRRSKKSPLGFVRTGVGACILSLILLAALPLLHPGPSMAEGEMNTSSMLALYSSAAALAYVSASVVNSLNTLASLECDEIQGDPKQVDRAGIARGKALGDFRSAGQLGRAFGPLFATGIYWARGPTLCYSVCACGSVAVYILSRSLQDYKVEKPVKAE